MASALMSLGVRAMFASFAQLQVTGQNIANAGVDGYSRQEAELATSKGQFTGAGFFGKGVDVATVSRAHDEFLTREAAAATSAAAMDRTRRDQLVQLEQVFPTGEQGIGYAAGQFLNAMVDLGSRPQDVPTRQVVLARAQEVAERFALAGRQLDTLQAGVTQDLKTDVARVNELARRIADLNQQIAGLKGLGHEPNDLLDQRDRLINELSGFVGVTTIPADDGTLGVFIAGGQRLVLGNQAQPLIVVPDTTDPSRSAVALDNSNGQRPLTPGMLLPLSSDLLTGGTISGLLRFQNDDLVAARTSVGQMALAFSSRVNDQLALGLDLDGNAGAPIFASLVDTSGVGASTNTGTAAIAVTAHMPDRVRAEEYALRYDGAAWKLTLADGSEPVGGPYSYTDAQLAAGQQIPELGITLTKTTGTASAGDRFLLQPVSRAAADMALVLADPRGVAAAAPASGTSPATDNGNALALAALRDETFVGRMPDGSGGQTVTDAYASAMAGVGVRVQSAKTAASLSDAAKVAVEKQRESVSGVNLDEEAARLIQFQQSYQAAAKVLQVAQQVFDTLLSIAAR